MSLFQSVIDLLAGLLEKDVVVGKRQTYLFEYDCFLPNNIPISIKTNGCDSLYSVPGDIFSEDYECNYRVGSMISSPSK